MSKINVLDSSVFNRIAAGEVVERPASIVKELVENSLDANAKHIVIEITQGGTQMIKISDDGDGIAYDDLSKAFLPHATSKIKCVDDLNNIATLGFRGEALASIASVSQTTILSKQKTAAIGGEISANGGKINPPKEAGCPDGTFITVNNLFYNTPVRAKFLKSNRVEEGAITNLVARFILANPNIAFKYVADGKTIYQTQGLDLTEGIFVVYSKEAVNNIIEVNYKSQDISLTGFVGNPLYVKPNKTYQTLIINGRYVVNNLVSTAVYNAFENYMMKGKFPFFVLHLNMPYDEVDVNVHPNKLDVRFQNTNKIYAIINNAVAESLLNSNKTFDGSEIAQEKFDEITLDSAEEKQTDLPRVSGFSFGDKKPPEPRVILEDVEPVKEPELKPENNIISAMKSATVYNSKSFGDSLLDSSELKSDDGIFYETLVKVTSDKEEKVQTTQEDLFFDTTTESKIIGKVFNTYIIIEKDKEVYFIDQHAAHERLLYDKFTQSFEEQKQLSQALLVPYVFKVNSLENNLILENIQTFNELGFEIEEFGTNTYKINSVPNLLQNINLKEYVDDLLKNLNKISKTNQNTKHFLATKACKAAVKAGMDLSELEIKELMDKILAQKTTLLCPHGRPICVKFDRTDMDKWFKRIL